MADYGSDTDNRKYKRKQIISVERQYGMQTLHNWDPKTQDYLEKCKFFRCPRCREGHWTYACVAISARDISVGAVIEDYPP